MNTEGQSRRTFLKAAVGALGAGILAACGGQAAPPVSSEPTAAAPPVSSAPTAAAAPAAPTAAAEAPPAPTAAVVAAGLAGKEGVLWGLQYDPHVETYKRLAALFEKQTGAKLSVQPQEWPIETKVITAMAAGTAPDAACIMGKVLVPLWMRNAVTDLTPFYQEQGIDPVKAFFPDSIQCYSHDGKFWGVPTETGTDDWIVNVPVDDVEKAGLKDKYPPTNGKDQFDSYEDMWQLAKALQTKDDAGNVTRWGISSKGWDSCTLLGIMHSLGVNWWDNDAKKFNFTTDAGIKAYQLHAETPVKMGIETELDQNHVDAALAGKVALAKGNGTPWIEGKKLGYNFDLAVTPPVKPGEFPKMGGEGGWGFAGFSQGKNKDVAHAFLKMMMTKEGQHEWAKIYGGKISALVALKDDLTIYTDENNKNGFLKLAKYPTLENTIYYGEGFGYESDMEKYVNGAASDIRSGKLNAEQATQQVQQQMEAGYKQFQEDLKKV